MAQPLRAADARQRARLTLAFGKELSRHDCLPFLKKEFYGEIPNLISKRSDGRTRWRMGGGWSRRTRGNRRSKSRRRICSSAAVSTKRSRRCSSRPMARSPQADTRGRLRSMAASRCSNYPLAKRLSRGPRASRRPAAATKSYECSGSIPLLKVDGTSILKFPRNSRTMRWSQRRLALSVPLSRLTSLVRRGSA